MLKKIIVGMLLISSMASADKIKIFEGTNLKWLESKVNEYTKYKVIKSVSITFSERYNTYTIVVSTAGGAELQEEK